MIIQVKARLDEAWLESGEVSTSPNPQFGTELAWEVEQNCQDQNLDNFIT